MATLNSTARTSEVVAARNERELQIDLHVDHWVQFEGSAAQLKEEGLIPEDFEWPVSNVDAYWSSNGFDFWLRRTRPKGHKGPMRSWLTMDNWFVRIEVSDRGVDYAINRMLERKTIELQDAYFRQTDTGQRVWAAKFQRYQAALSDERFQAFKGAIQGMVPLKRGRKTMAGA